MTRLARARERLLDAAEELLLARGYGATQLDRVAETAGVSKGAVFYHFDSKELLTEAAVERFFDRLVAEGTALAASAGTSTAVARLLAYIDAVAVLIETPALARGCLLGVVRMECSEISPRLAAATGGAFDRWERALAALIKDAGAERGVELDATALAKAFLSGVEGGLLLDRRGTERRAARAAIDHFRTYLVLLLKGEEESE